MRTAERYQAKGEPGRVLPVLVSRGRFEARARLDQLCGRGRQALEIGECPRRAGLPAVRDAVRREPDDRDHEASAGVTNGIGIGDHVARLVEPRERGRSVAPRERDLSTLAQDVGGIGRLCARLRGVLRGYCLLTVVLVACAHGPGVTLPMATTLHVRAAGVAPGAPRDPWFSGLEAALAAATPGTTIVVHGPLVLDAQVHVATSGREGAWITIAGDRAEPAVLDASRIVIRAPGGPGRSAHDDGAITLRGVHHVTVRGLTIVDAPSAGIAVHDSTDIRVEGNRIERSFGSGIAAWDSDHVAGGCERVRILGNTVRHANDVAIAPPWFARTSEPPHEAISIGGAVDFEVGFNEVIDARKEGIDVKETSARGRVHHNHVHGAARQCLYVDAWFGRLTAIEFDHNLGERCRGAGLAISVEGEGDTAIEGVEIHDNVLRDNLGSGILFGRWGADGPRRDIAIHHNTVEHNGHGPPADGQAFFWITGGLYLFSANVAGLVVSENRFVDNRGFQIGTGEAWRAQQPDIAAARIVVADNVTRGDVADPAISVGSAGKVEQVREWPADRPARPADGDRSGAAGARLDVADVGPAAWRRERV